MLVQDIIGLHAPNKRLSEIPGGPDAFWRQAQLGRAAWVKLLWPDHSRADAVRARALGRRVIVRAPGEGICFAVDLRAMLKEFAGVADVFELGNEPQPGDLWVHCFHVAYDVLEVKTDCNRAGIRLISPGWGGNAEPPKQPLDERGKPDNRPWDKWPVGDHRRLAARIIQVYGTLDGIGFHAYGEHVLEGPQVGRIQRWAALFPKMLLYGTEIGIAARDLRSVPPAPEQFEPSKLIKAERYAAFAGMLSAECDQVAMLGVFIGDGCTPEWQSFDGGQRGYTIGDAGWERLGQKIGASAALREVG